jgi:hypothetical protein
VSSEILGGGRLLRSIVRRHVSTMLARSIDWRVIFDRRETKDGDAALPKAARTPSPWVDAISGRSPSFPPSPNLIRYRHAIVDLGSLRHQKVTAYYARTVASMLLGVQKSTR